MEGAAAHASRPAPVWRMLSESSMATMTWYCRLDGLVRRSQILSLRKPEAMYGMTLRIAIRFPVR